jgi:hypothetical protein
MPVNREVKVKVDATTTAATPVHGVGRVKDMTTGDAR